MNQSQPLNDDDRKALELLPDLPASLPMTSAGRVQIDGRRFRLFDGGHCYVDTRLNPGRLLEVNRMPSRIQGDDLAAFVQFLTTTLAADQNGTQQ